MRSVLSSECRLPFLLVAGPSGMIALAVPAAAQDLVAPHQPRPHPGMLALDFDLVPLDPRAVLALAEAEEVAESEDEEEGALDEPEMPIRPWDDDGLKREWSIIPIDHGPALEVAALGGGRKKSGKLAHVRVSWAF